MFSIKNCSLLSLQWLELVNHCHISNWTYAVTWKFGWVARQGEVKDIGKGLGIMGVHQVVMLRFRGRYHHFLYLRGWRNWIEVSKSGFGGGVPIVRHYHDNLVPNFPGRLVTYLDISVIAPSQFPILNISITSLPFPILHLTSQSWYPPSPDHSNYSAYDHNILWSSNYNTIYLGFLIPQTLCLLVPVSLSHQCTNWLQSMPALLPMPPILFAVTE